ncbi:hypothetical protein IKF04_00900 [Candidatus Saccharibacteria bacterium]|nr:hypothetical protein [Candidatus Saccharibacteria bacterium]
MDNGHPKQMNPNGQPFDGRFPNGANMNQGNPFNPNNAPGANGDWSTTNLGQPGEHNIGKIGVEAISFLESETPEELGKIETVEAGMPPGYPETESTTLAKEESAQNDTIPFTAAQLGALRAAGEKRASAAVVEFVKNEIDEFESGKKSPADIYKEAQEARETLYNSHGKKFGDGTPVIPGADEEARKGKVA